MCNSIAFQDDRYKNLNLENSELYCIIVGTYVSKYKYLLYWYIPPINIYRIVYHDLSRYKIRYYLVNI